MHKPPFLRGTGTTNGMGYTTAVNSLNSDYMHSIMNVTDSPATHRGTFMARDFPSGEQLSPTYELQINDGDNYYFTAFYDDASGTHFHQMAHLNDVYLDKRVSSPNPDYDGVRWASGGIDWPNTIIFYRHGLQL